MDGGDSWIGDVGAADVVAGTLQAKCAVWIVPTNSHLLRGQQLYARSLGQISGHLLTSPYVDFLH